MDRKAVIFAASLPAILAGLFVALSHTSLWPEPLARLTDSYAPQGPTNTFSDFSPSSRTGALVSNGRPITGSPVYLLFQPRRHTKNIRVEISASEPGMQIGYRDGDGPEDNVFVATSHSGLISSATLPFDRMTRERTDARRIVVSTTSTTMIISSIRIFYED